MSYFHNLPDEVILQILSYSETKDLISCGQLSKRIRRISRYGSLWVKADLGKKIVKAELLEMILSKGCRILNLSNSTIIGSLSSNIKSQLQILDLSQPGRIARWDRFRDEKSIAVFKELLFSCCSLQHLVNEGLQLTTKIAISICKNGKTLQILNLNYSFAHEWEWGTLRFFPASIVHLQEIIKSCQGLKELHLRHFLETILDDHNTIDFLVENMPPNVEKLDLLGLDYVRDDQFAILLRRCNKIKILSLEAYHISDESLTNIRQYLNLTLEELSLAQADNNVISFNGFLALKFMPKLKILNLLYNDGLEVEEWNLRLHLPHLMINLSSE